MVLVYIESHGGSVKKASLEAITYGYKTAQQMGVECGAVVIGSIGDATSLGDYGASKVMTIESANLEGFDSQTYTQVIAAAAEKASASVIILPHNSSGKSIAGRLGVRLNAGVVTAANSLPNTDGGFKVKKNVFAGKAIAEYEIKSPTKVLTLSLNSIQPESMGGSASVEALDIEVPASKVTIVEKKLQQGDVAPLPEAELVVSAGRGMKGPENWGIIEDLAAVIGATTACSRPVADTGWRPHHEHVGQTGVAIKPNLYIAAGISGAIQHLAGVNSSKCIVVINKDPEAPFFKAADYGVCADLFDVVPKLTEAIRKAKA